MDQNSETDVKANSKSSPAIWIAMAGGVYFLLTNLDGFIATPLRQTSSVISHFLLQICSFPVTREGTILSTPDLTFDVVPACCGSTTLRVLVGVGIFWCGTHPRLNFLRKVIGSFLTVPIALLANGVRVGILVGVSYMLNTVVAEGTLHSLIGIFGFVLAMLCFYIMTESLVMAKHQSKSQHRHNYLSLGLLIIILGLIYFPFLWKYWDFYNPVNSYGRNDRFGIFLMIIAIGVGFIQWLRMPNDVRFFKGAVVIFLISMVIVFVSLRVDITYFLGISILTTLFSVVYAYKGRAFAVSAIPLLIIIYLGYPHIAMQINWVTTRLFNITTLNTNMFLRIPTALLLLGLYWKLRARVPMDVVPMLEPKRFIHISMAMAMVMLAFQGHTYSMANKNNIETKLMLSYIQSEWIGEDLPLSDSSIEFFGKGNIWLRKYIKDDREIRVLINASGGNRHRNHPPEYCLTGGGWRVDKRFDVVHQIGPENKMRTTEMELVKDGRRQTIIYWLEDGHSNYPNYNAMTIEDTKRRLAGLRTNWFLFRIISGADREVLDDFLSSFQYSLDSPERS